MDQDHTLLHIAQKKIREGGRREKGVEWYVKFSL